MFLMVVWLACTAGSTQLLEPNDRIPIDATRNVWRAPQLPAWPSDLPPLYATPQDAVCFATPMGFELGDGVWLSIERSDFESHVLELVFDLPRRFQLQLDDLRLIEVPALVDAELKRHLAAAKARWLRKRANESEGSFLDWLVGATVIGAALIGALIYAGASIRRLHEG
jgi:hypothetical protein